MLVKPNFFFFFFLLDPARMWAHSVWDRWGKILRIFLKFLMQTEFFVWIVELFFLPVKKKIFFFFPTKIFFFFFFPVSQVEKQRDSKTKEKSYIWHCEFCGKSQPISGKFRRKLCKLTKISSSSSENSKQEESDFSSENSPSLSTLDYILHPPPSSSSSSSPKNVFSSLHDDSYILFVVDTSGSMSTTTTLPTGHGLVKIKGVTSQYISRLQALQAGIDLQIHEIAKANAKKTVLLCSFSNIIKWFGDGMEEPREVVAPGVGKKGKNLEIKIEKPGEKEIEGKEEEKTDEEKKIPEKIPTRKEFYNDFDSLIQSGLNLDLSYVASVGSTRESFSSRLFSIEEGGSTALGPALTFVTGVAAQKRGSEIILCTDGLPNEGLGTDASSRQAFYERLAKYAESAGVSISVLGIEGTDCDVTSLSVLSSVTGGAVNVVNPLELTRQMRQIIDNPTVCMGVEMRGWLTSGLQWRNFEENLVRKRERDNSLVTWQYGNITAEADISFEFGVSDPVKKIILFFFSIFFKKKKKKQKNISFLKTKEKLFLQFQIRFSRKDKSEYIRNITCSFLPTLTRPIAEAEPIVAVLSMHTIQAASRMALAGKSVPARNFLESTQKMLAKISKSDVQLEEYANYVTFMEDLETIILNIKPGSVMSDDVVKNLQRMKNLGRVVFLAGSKKEEIVKSRKKHVH
jgi:hypothetical protein